MQSSFVESLIGAAVLVVAGLFVYYAWNRTDTGAVVGYELIARFDRVDGISPGSDVKLAGIKIGTVKAQELDPSTFRALVRLSIKSGVQVPDDSSVKITSEGLLGGSYLSVSPGGSDAMLANGGEIKSTQGSIDLVGLLSRAFLSGGGTESKPATETPGAQPQPAAPQ